MGTTDRLGLYGFSATGRVYGVALGIRRRLHVVGVCQRGMFWRFGARIFQPIDGYWESVFGVHSRIKLIETMLKVGMKDEVIPLRIRPGRVCGSIHFSRTGCVSFVVVALNPEIFPPVNPADCGFLSQADNKGEAASIASSEGWY